MRIKQRVQRRTNHDARYVSGARWVGRVVAQVGAKPRVAVPLKLELEGELDRTRTANLIERAKTAIGATGAQAVR
jgi:hypothetical protein